MEEVIKFIYTVKANITVNNVVDLFALADRFLLDGLKAQCCMFNGYGTQELAQILASSRIVAPMLYGVASQLLEYDPDKRVDAAAFLVSDSFLALPSAVVADILKLSIRLAEFTIATAAYRWAQSDLNGPGTFEEKIAPLLQHIRLSQIQDCTIVELPQLFKLFPGQSFVDRIAWNMDPGHLADHSAHMPRTCQAYVLIPGTQGTHSVTIPFGLPCSWEVKLTVAGEKMTFSLATDTATCFGYNVEFVNTQFPFNRGRLRAPNAHKTDYW
eukprot:TRINITY_DN3636_c0_g1_i1.p1 TRINITY_DN3636_c0_g1~~TRINITY_DN3636_c0_g1_i1.p1  ORF type:complete len:295 (+),score=13.81 TRINITY_DN3636_c0_g1_i1:78-887(+)